MSEHERTTLQIRSDLARFQREADAQLNSDIDDASLRKLVKEWRQELKKGDPHKAKRVIKLFVRKIKAYKHQGLAEYTAPLWKITCTQCTPTGRQPLYATPAVTIVYDKARKGQPVGRTGLAAFSLTSNSRPAPAVADRQNRHRTAGRPARCRGPAAAA